MTYTATITDPHEADAMPMWESFGHADPDDALQAAQTHVHTAQPGDRIVDQAHGAYAIWGTDSDGRWTQVATLVIAPTDELRDTSVMSP